MRIWEKTECGRKRMDIAEPDRQNELGKSGDDRRRQPRQMYSGARPRSLPPANRLNQPARVPRIFGPAVSPVQFHLRIVRFR